MTLITNEIHILDGFRKTILIFAADRRISKPDGSYHSTRRKLFEIPYLEGGISYFGLAEVFPRGRRQFLSDWLPAFILKQSSVRDLKEFSGRLRDELNRVVPPQILRTTPSGFHIAGYNAEGLPEFWFVRNIGGMDAFTYKDLKPRYQEPTGDFLDRDAKTLGWDGVRLDSISNCVQIYRNGDVRAHVSVWNRLDEAFREMIAFPDIKKPKKPDDLAGWIKFKFETIARFYKQFAHKELIARPIDVFCRSKDLKGKENPSQAAAKGEA